MAIGFVRHLGGAAEDTVRDVAVTAGGDLIAVGGTASADFPTTEGAWSRHLDPRHDGGRFGAHDAWVARLAPDGTLRWATLVGGPGYDRAYAVEVADDGIVVAGRAGVGFPTTPGVLQPAFAGDTRPNRGYGPQDGFVLKLDPAGDRLLWSTYFGESGRGFLRDLDLDARGRVYVVEAQVHERSPHVTPDAWDPGPPEGEGAVVARLSADGRRVQWATYLGGRGSSLDNPSIRVNEAGEVFVMGETRADDYPLHHAFQPARAGERDITLTGLGADGRTLLFSTYLGGSGPDRTETHGLAIGPDGDLYVAGDTVSPDFPVTAGALQRRYRGGRRGDAFVARFTRRGRRVAATFLGGSRGDGAEGVAVDARGRVWLTGFTASADFPTTADAFQRALAGGRDWFLVRLAPALDVVEFSSLLGGRGDDAGRSAAVASTGRVVAGGQTRSGDWPATHGGAPAGAGSGSGYDARDAAIVVLDALGPQRESPAPGTSGSRSRSTDRSGGGPGARPVARASGGGPAPQPAAERAKGAATTGND